MRSMITWLVACALGFFWAYCASAAGVIESKREFDAVISNMKRPAVIMEHADWCFWCKKAMPAYLMEEKFFAGKVDFYVVDVDKFKMPLGHKAEGIPAFTCGRTKAELLSGKRQLDGYLPEPRFGQFLELCTGVTP